MGKLKGMFLAAAIAALGVMGTGCEDDDPIGAGSAFDAIDLNDDGLISVSEWDAAFDTWDVDDDGFVAQSEYPLNGGFASLDVDANGLLSDVEWSAATTDWDVDGDYSLGPGELFY